MKKFKHRVEAYSLGRIRPMAIEQDRAGLGKYVRLTDNPLYYYNALQYTGGSLYRASLGYEIFWDKQVEAQLMLCLDYLLTDYRDKQLYYIEEFTALTDLNQHGIKWHRGLAPQTLNFDMMWPFEIKKGERYTARVNLLDKPNHVDLELPNGEIYTLQFLRYQRLLTKFRRRGSYVKRTTTANRPTSIPGSKSPSLSLVNKIGQHFSLKKLPVKLSYMRQGYGRQNAF